MFLSQFLRLKFFFLKLVFLSEYPIKRAIFTSNTSDIILSKICNFIFLK